MYLPLTTDDYISMPFAQVLTRQMRKTRRVGEHAVSGGGDRSMDCSIDHGTHHLTFMGFFARY
jgi:hypothetical protein